MKKSVLAVAVGAAMAMASAAHADVSVYGKAHVSIDSLNNGDKSYIYVSSNSSRIGFKASEEIDGGLKAGFLAEQTITMDGVGTSVFDRETYVTLGGGFGNFAVGKIDTPMKTLGRKIDFFGDQIGDSRNLTSQSFSGADLGITSTAICMGTTPGPALTACLAAAATALKAKNIGFDARPGNMITYTTSDMGGIGATVAFIPEDGTKNGSGFDVGVNYTSGPLFVGGAYETHGKGMNGGGESESGLRLGASFGTGDLKVAGMFQSSKNIYGYKDLNNTIIGVGASFKLGAGAVKGQIYKANKYKDEPKSGASMIALGYDHSLSKNTSVYAAYAVTNNDDAGHYSVAGAGHGANPGFAVSSSGKSESPSGLSFGMITKF